MRALQVLDGGILTTVQDLGRDGLQEYGVPVSGAMDSYSLRAANRLVGNAEGAGALEMTMKGAALKATEDMLVAVTGAELPLAINGSPQPSWQTLHLSKGDVLSCGLVKRGARVYLAVSGGVDVPLMMGSRSTFLRGSIGGLLGRPLRAGDVLPVGAAEDRTQLVGSFIPLGLQPRLPQAVTHVRIVFGPQDDYFTEDAIAKFVSEVFTVTAESDRMGFRLEGGKLTHRDKADIVSDGIAPGSIQVPGHGMPIVMLADRQTTGGYPKIATVISADLPLFGQMKPGDKLCFVAVTYDEAVKLLRQMEDRLASVPMRSIAPRRLRISVSGQLFNVEVREVE